MSNAYAAMVPDFLMGLARQLNEASEESRTEQDIALAAAKLRGAMTAVAIMLEVDAKVLRDSLEAHSGKN
jgi:hypothetical protein